MNISEIFTINTDNQSLGQAFRIAIGDVCSNLVEKQMGQLEEPAICLAAGITYPTLWTRDNAVNTMNFAGLFLPDVAKNSLRAVLENHPEDGGWRIGGQYWDCIIWAEGVWSYYLYQGDRDFLAESLGIIERSLTFFEATEFDEACGLFRGPAFFQDGISGYPDECAGNFGSDVRDWVSANPDSKAPKGFGIPWFSLSTNCLYVRAYQVVQMIRSELGLEASDAAKNKESTLKTAIRKQFWNDQRGSFDYMLLPEGRRCEHQEGSGLAFAILFDLATPDQKASIFRTVYRAPAGIPALWPTFPRYKSVSGSPLMEDFYGQHFRAERFGRHSGTVWPQVQAYWALASLNEGRTDFFDYEFWRLIKASVRDGQFSEIFHPLTGEEYGGLQEHYSQSYITEWASVPRTAWGSTGFLALIHKGLAGMHYNTEGIRFKPYLPQEINELQLRNIPYRSALLHVTIEGQGNRIQSFSINGRSVTENFLPANFQGQADIRITLFAD
jgi:hypothetical protein